MDERLKLIFNSGLLEAEYRESTLIDSNIKVKWLPVLRCGETHRNMGLIEDGTWVVEESPGLRLLNKTRSFMRVVVLLEQPMDKVRDEIKEFFSQFKIDLDIDLVFPFVDVTRAGFEFGTEYWAELAFKWYEKLPPKDKALLKASLLTISDVKWASQKLRHKAKRELKTISQYNEKRW
ncbi:hypothetical protein ACFO25_10480 [Paenactinomyces guangxiensis]|uniref:Uncharacterized protein n=1 Tax=Paenactinomyces guangxiensis TaxID=1490290 RepID=A0A7W2AA69_9BACL|nr:hypothetical protein [Paenactinomyces guangxiensis]MBA4496475.1 hypothetical protein [Paenactinomyces guangxiensis]MBH8593599.1 hypothetical protein [Paenactinomyces guangxiensis]